MFREVKYKIALGFDGDIGIVYKNNDETFIWDHRSPRTFQKYLTHEWHTIVFDDEMTPEEKGTRNTIEWLRLLEKEGFKNFQ